MSPKLSLLLLFLSILTACQNEKPLLMGNLTKTVQANPIVELGSIPTKSIQESLRSMDAEIIQQDVPTEALAIWLQEAISSEIDPLLIQEELMKNDWIEDVADWNVVDLNGDGENEWLVTIYLADFRATWGRPGDFWIVSQDGLAYQFFSPESYFCYSPCSLEENGLSFFRDAPQVIAIADLTGDGLPDIVLDTNICGAHTCTQNYYILSSHHGKVQNLLELPYERFVWGDVISSWYTKESSAIIMTYSKLLGVKDVTGDKIADVLIYGGWHGSGGSGIQNTRTEVWSWNGHAISLTDVQWHPTNYRVHLLWEGNNNYYVGNYEKANALFLQVINEDSLLEPPVNRQDFQLLSYDSNRRFAAFRLILIALLENDKQQAVDWQRWLNINYPEIPTTHAAALLLDEVDNGADLYGACEKVTDYLLPFETVDYIVDRINPTGVLYMDMGYANPSLKVEDMCLIVEGKREN